MESWCVLCFFSVFFCLSSLFSPSVQFFRQSHSVRLRELLFGEFQYDSVAVRKPYDYESTRLQGRVFSTAEMCSEDCNWWSNRESNHFGRSFSCKANPSIHLSIRPFIFLLYRLYYTWSQEPFGAKTVQKCQLAYYTWKGKPDKPPKVQGEQVYINVLYYVYGTHRGTWMADTCIKPFKNMVDWMMLSVRRA